MHLELILIQALYGPFPFPGFYTSRLVSLLSSACVYTSRLVPLLSSACVYTSRLVPLLSSACVGIVMAAANSLRSVAATVYNLPFRAWGWSRSILLHYITLLPPSGLGQRLPSLVDAS